MADELFETTASDARAALGVPGVLIKELCGIGMLVVGKCFFGQSLDLIFNFPASNIDALGLEGNRH
jgi:hypothetical protein